MSIRICMVLCPKAHKGVSSGLLIVAVLSIRICMVLCPKADKGASSGPLIVASLSIRICLVLCPKADKGASSGPLIVAVLSIRICLVLCPKADKGAGSGPLIVAVLSIRICLVLCPKADKGAISGPELVRVCFCQCDLSAHGPWAWTWKPAWKGAWCCPTPGAPHEARLVVHSCGYAPLAFCRRERLSANRGQSCVGAPCLPACARGAHCPRWSPHVRPARGLLGRAVPHPGRRAAPHRFTRVDARRACARGCAGPGRLLRLLLTPILWTQMRPSEQRWPMPPLGFTLKFLTADGLTPQNRCPDPEISNY